MSLYTLIIIHLFYYRNTFILSGVQEDNHQILLVVPASGRTACFVHAIPVLLAVGLLGTYSYPRSYSAPDNKKDMGDEEMGRKLPSPGAKWIGLANMHIRNGGFFLRTGRYGPRRACCG